MEVSSSLERELQWLAARWSPVLEEPWSLGLQWSAGLLQVCNHEYKGPNRPLEQTRLLG